MEEVVIVGGGIAGLATALALQKYGIESLVLERAEGLRATGAALTLFPNAWLALDALAVSHNLTSIYAPLTKSYFFNVATKAIQEVSYSRTDGRGSGPRTVHRKALLKALADELPANSIRFSSKVSFIHTENKDGSIVVVGLEDKTVIRTKVLIGCDGVNSVVARWLGLSAPVHSGRAAVRGLSVFDQGHGLKHEVQQFLDVGKRAGIVPLDNKAVYWFMTCNSTPKVEEIGSEPELVKREVIENIARDFPEIYLDTVHHTDLSTLTWAPLMLRVPWDLIFGNVSKRNVVVAGDAMHPMTPDLGQGGASALEDAVVLGRHIGESYHRYGTLVPEDVVEAIEGYVKERKWRVAGLITGSYLSGWAQQVGSVWWMKFFRDVVFYRIIFPKFLNFTRYDCGKLPDQGKIA